MNQTDDVQALRFSGTFLTQDIRSGNWGADTRDSNSDKDGDHACGDLCAAIVLVICKNEKEIYYGNEGIESFKHCMKKL